MLCQPWPYFFTLSHFYHTAIFFHTKPYFFTTSLIFSHPPIFLQPDLEKVATLACILSGRQKTFCKNAGFWTHFNSRKHMIYDFFGHKIPPICYKFNIFLLQKAKLPVCTLFLREIIVSAEISISKVLQKTFNLVLLVQKL